MTLARFFVEKLVECGIASETTSRAIPGLCSGLSGSAWKTPPWAGWSGTSRGTWRYPSSAWDDEATENFIKDLIVRNPKTGVERKATLGVTKKRGWFYEDVSRHSHSQPAQHPDVGAHHQLQSDSLDYGVRPGQGLSGNLPLHVGASFAILVEHHVRRVDRSAEKRGSLPTRRQLRGVSFARGRKP